MGGELVYDDVTVRYGRAGRPRVTAVDRASLRVSPGEVVGLVGESGCGKSTLAKVACGLVPVSGGTVSFDGTPVTTYGLRKRAPRLLRLQMVFQNPYASLNPRRRVGSQLEDARSIHPSGAPPVAELLGTVGLDADAAARYPHQFSGGQRQRVAIARAMATGPDLLIGDEPIASLDASLQAQVARLMRDVALASGASLLFISHDLSVVRLIADRVVVMQAGRIVEQGTTEQVWAAPQAAYTRRLLAAIPVADGLGIIPDVSAQV